MMLFLHFVRFTRAAATRLIRSKARLTALEKAIELEKELLARDLLLEESWQISELPELAILAINALKIGQAQLAAEAPDKAIACLRLVPPYESLVKAQKERLLTTQARFESKNRAWACMRADSLDTVLPKN